MAKRKHWKRNPNKYRARRTWVTPQLTLAEDPQGIEPSLQKTIRDELKDQGCLCFDSKKEAGRYVDLKLMEDEGKISELECQPRFVIRVEDTKLCTYVADFKYKVRGEDRVTVEDVKSPATMTPVFKLKFKLVKICYPDLHFVTWPVSL